VGKIKHKADGTIQYGNLTISKEHNNLTAVMSDPNWKVVIDFEFSSLVWNNT
jgi:hypothetical protein